MNPISQNRYTKMTVDDEVKKCYVDKSTVLHGNFVKLLELGSLISEEKNLQCEIQAVLEFCKKESFFQTSAVERTSSLIAIHPVTGKDAKELRSLEDLWKVQACGRTLEAKIRDSVKELKLNCPVKLNNLNRAMTRSLDNGYEVRGLLIREDYIHVEVSLIKEVIRAIQMQKSAKVFSVEFQELLENLKDLLLELFDKMEGTLLKIQLYEEFSILETTCPGKIEHAHELEGDGERMVSETCTFSTTTKQVVCIPNNPRSGRIIAMTVTEMEKYIEEKIGEGAFGKVYKAKKVIEECEFVIRKIKVTEEVYQRSYEKETECGRILHPFINPVIARAEFPAVPEVEIYLMYPYMKNKDLRYNIDLENCRMRLSQEETNSRIWTRCIYQIVQGVDYLHKLLEPVRGPIFHRDLTSRNIFLDENFNVRIGDFGIAAEANFSATLAREFTTEGYHPPNMNQYKYNASCDVFSVGVVMIEILTGEMAVLNNDPYFLYKKYHRDEGIEYLKEYLDERAEENEAAAWINKDHRDMLAEKALNVISLNGTCKEAVVLLQELEEMRLDAKERYREPKITDRCVSCYINPTAKLSLKGADCVGNKTEEACRPFCVHCLMNHHINPLVCPKHGKTRPPFGDHVYGVFVAGNNVEDMQQSLYGKHQSYSIRDVAQIFINDVEKVVKILTAKYPLILGANDEESRHRSRSEMRASHHDDCVQERFIAEHLKIVKANNPGTKEDMKTRIREAFENVNSAINKALKKINQNPKNHRLKNSLFIFYFSGHCSKEKGLYLGNAEESLKASTTGTEKKTLKPSTKWILEMLHNNLRVDQVLVILDCCHADSQNFANRPGLKTGSKCPVNIFQLPSYDAYEKSNSRFMNQGLGSYFTHFLCQSLQGLDSTGWEDDAIVCCEECEKLRRNKNQMEMALPCVKYHTQCRKNQCLKVSSIKDFIQGHFDLLWGEIGSCGRIQQNKDIVLAYYNPCKTYVTIHLKGSDNTFCMSTHQESMDDLKQGIISYIVEKKVICDILLLHENCGRGSSHLIAICQKNCPDKNDELTSLESIYKAWSLGRELEAQVRENISGLIHGPVKVTSVTKSMVTDSQEHCDEDYLKINKANIHIPIKSISKAEEKLWKMKQSNILIQEVLQVIRNLYTSGKRSALKDNQDKVLRFNLYDNFSVVTIQ